MLLSSFAKAAFYGSLTAGLFGTAIGYRRGPAPSGLEVLTRMHDTYADHWYHTLSFDQYNTAWDSTGAQKHSNWREFAKNPGLLRINYGAVENHSGALVRNDSAYSFVRGVLRNTRPYIEAFAILLNDVYCQTPDLSARRLDSLGFSLTKTYTRVWEGKSVVVVGAASAADTTTAQFWVDAKRWLVTRVIQTETRGKPTLTDVRVVSRAPMPVPVETELMFFENGKPNWREQYSNVHINPALPNALFDPAQFVATHDFWIPPL